MAVSSGILLNRLFLASQPPQKRTQYVQTNVDKRWISTLKIYGLQTPYFQVNNGSNIKYLSRINVLDKQLAILYRARLQGNYVLSHINKSSTTILVAQKAITHQTL